MSNFGKFLGGLVMGSALGGVLGLLLAPKSGKETRQKIIDKTSDGYKKAENAITDIQKKADEAIEDLQKSGKDVLKKVSESLEKSEEVVEIEAEEKKAEENTQPQE